MVYCDHRTPASHTGVRLWRTQVSVNGVSKCDGVRKDRRAFRTAHVYVSDPWHAPALATIDNLIMVRQCPGTRARVTLEPLLLVYQHRTSPKLSALASVKAASHRRRRCNRARAA